MATIAVKGLSDLQRFLDELPAKVERNALRGALRAGANVIKPVAQANIHSISGATAKSLKVRTDARGGRVTASVYTRYFVGRLLEYTGAKPHRITPAIAKAISIGGHAYSAVNHPGFSPKPFLRPALDTRASEAVVAVGEYLKLRLATKHGLDTSGVAVEAE
jgi:HK97 gp10 family phage protein